MRVPGGSVTWRPTKRCDAWKRNWALVVIATTFSVALPCAGLNRQCMGDTAPAVGKRAGRCVEPDTKSASVRYAAVSTICAVFQTGCIMN